MTTAITNDPQRVFDRSRNDPAWFWDHILGCRVYDKQRQMVEAVRDHPRVAVVGCNGSGKDFQAGRIILWWQSVHYPAKTVVIGPTNRQVHDIVFSESRSGFRNARALLQGSFFKTSRWAFDDNHVAVGFATTDPFNIQGYHSPNLLVIVTEAHNVPEEQFRAIERLNPTRMLLTGNPLADAGEFYDAFHARTHAWKGVEISAFDTPNVQQRRRVFPGLVTYQDVEDKLEKYGEESPLYIAGVLGRFPDNLEDSVVPRSLLLKAVARAIVPTEDARAKLSCDVARFGEDDTVIYKRKGHQNRLVQRMSGRDTQQIAGRLIALVNEGEHSDVDTIVVDDVEVGGGVTDRLREEHPRNGQVHIVAFNGGSQAKDKDKYANAVTEAWYNVREAAIEEMLDIDDNPMVIGQLASRHFNYLGSGRVQLESKEEYKKRAGGSPDDADALAMLYSAAATQGPPGIRWL